MKKLALVLVLATLILVGCGKSRRRGGLLSVVPPTPTPTPTGDNGNNSGNGNGNNGNVGDGSGGSGGGSSGGSGGGSSGGGSGGSGGGSSGGGSGGSGGGSTANGSAAPIRLDTWTGASPPSVSLQDNLLHNYTFTAISGITYNLTITTNPNNSDLQIILNGGGFVNNLWNTIAPVSSQFTPTQDGVITISVYDPKQANVTLLSISVTPNTRPYNANTFSCVISLAANNFQGYGSYNGLALGTDKNQFSRDLLNGANQHLLSTGVQIDVNDSTQQMFKHDKSSVAAVNPLFIVNNDTALTTANCELWGHFAVPSSDSISGKALDIIIVRHAVDMETYAATPGREFGGVFVGAGGSHYIVLTMFDNQGNPIPMDKLIRNLTHSLGLFLSLPNTTEKNWQADGFLDTPFSDKLLHDTNANGVLDELDNPTPDNQYYMYPFVRSAQNLWSTQQSNAMKDYLSLRQH